MFVVLISLVIRRGSTPDGQDYKDLWIISIQCSEQAPLSRELQ